MATQDKTLLYSLGTIYIALGEAMNAATGRRVDLMADEILRSMLDDDNHDIPPDAEELLWCLLDDDDEYVSGPDK